MFRDSSAARALIVMTALAGWACSGQKDPLAPSASSASSAFSTVRSSSSAGVIHITDGAAPSPSPTPVISNGSCPVGHGVVEPACTSKGAGQFNDQVEASIAQVIHEHPDWFDFDRYRGDGGYHVHDSDIVNAEVVRQLQNRGLCAYFDFVRQLVQVKTSDTVSEDYAVVDDAHLRRGTASFRSSCSPAAFPVNPADWIDHVRVAFYDVICEDGRTPPRNGEGKVPMGCYGIVTATPKKADNTDVDSRIHGPEISWTLTQVDDFIDVREFPDVAFNKYVKGLDPGTFRLCATVLGKEGCMNGEVIN